MNDTGYRKTIELFAIDLTYVWYRKTIELFAIDPTYEWYRKTIELFAIDLTYVIQEDYKIVCNTTYG